MAKPGNKGKTYRATVLTAGEFARVVDQIHGDSATALRNRALLITCYRGALRNAEVCDLRPDDVDLATGRLDVRRGKGGKARVVGLDATATAALAAWLDRRDDLGWGDDSYLFGAIYSRGDGAPGGKLHTSYLRRLLPKLAKAAGIKRRVNPHCLRHSRAHELDVGGASHTIIKKALGHSNLATTSTYLDHIASDDVVAAMT